MARYRMAAVQYGLTVLAGIASVGFQRNNRVFNPKADGKFNPRYRARTFGAPYIRFGIYDIAAAISSLGIAPLKTVSDFVFTYVEQDKVGAAGAGTHETLTVASGEGVLVPLRVGAQQDSDGVILEYGLFPVKAAGTSPVAKGTGSVPSGLSWGSAFKMGPVNVNGSAWSGVRDWSLEWGWQESSVGADGSDFPKFVDIDFHDPVFRMVSVDLATQLDLADGGVTGSAASHFYLTKLAKGGASVAGATTEHVRFSTGSSAVIQAGDVEGDFAEGVVEVLPCEDGSGNVVVATSGVALP